jgi:hypothetical protein
MWSLDRNHIQRPRNISNNSPLPTRFCHEQGDTISTGTHECDGINELIGMIDGINNGSVLGDILSPNNLDSAKENGQDRLKESLGEKKQGLSIPRSI